MNGIVLFAHGSRDPAWRAPIEAIATRMREIAPGVLISCAFLELTQPDLPSCVADMQDQGVSAITIWPMFLGTGRHAREDLPRLVTDLRARYPSVAFTLRPAIGEHPAVLEAMAQAALET